MELRAQLVEEKRTSNCNLKTTHILIKNIQDKQVFEKKRLSKQPQKNKTFSKFIDQLLELLPVTDAAADDVRAIEKSFGVSVTDLRARRPFRELTAAKRRKI